MISVKLVQFVPGGSVSGLVYMMTSSDCPVEKICKLKNILLLNDISVQVESKLK